MRLKTKQQGMVANKCESRNGAETWNIDDIPYQLEYNPWACKVRQEFW